MKKHLETNYRFPLLILALLVIATLTASFYAGSQTAGTFRFSPRAFFEGPFLGIGIGNLPGFNQPGFNQNEQGQVSTEPKLCLVCTENGYCENDILSNAFSSCEYSNSSIDQKAACNQACAQRTHTGDGRKISLFSQASTCTSMGDYRCSPRGNNKSVVQMCKQCTEANCDPKKGYWSDTNTTCDENKGELCVDKEPECKKTAVGEICETADAYTCIGNTSYLCKIDEGATNPTWHSAMVCGGDQPTCDHETGICAPTLSSCTEELRGITKCDGPGTDGLVKATTCNEKGTDVEIEYCGLGEQCVSGKDGGCVPIVSGKIICEEKDTDNYPDICSGDRKSVLTCKGGAYVTKDSGCRDNLPICVYGANGANCSADGSLCDENGASTNDTRCGIDNPKQQEQCFDDGGGKYSWKPIRLCTSCNAGICNGTIPPTLNCGTPPLSTCTTCGKDGKWLCPDPQSKDCSKEASPTAGCTCAGAGNPWVCPTDSVTTPAECSSQCKKDQVTVGTVCGCGGNAKRRPLYYKDCTIKGTGGAADIICSDKPTGGCTTVDDAECEDADNDGEPDDEEKKGAKGDDCGLKDEPPCGGNLFCNWQDSGRVGGVCDDRKAQVETCTPNPADPSSNCGEGYICRGTSCIPSGGGNGQPGDPCEHEGDCADGRSCENGRCAKNGLPGGENSCESRGGGCVSGCGSCDGGCHGSGGCSAGICCI